MLSPEQMRQVEQLSGQLAPRQLDWLSGYLAGLHSAPAAVPSLQISEPPRATVLYGSQTGNGKILAEQAAAAIRQRGLAAAVISMGDYKTARLKKERFLFVVVSTHGEGDPPDSAAEFFDFLRGTRAPKLPELSYSVLALGDSSYDHFCRAGRDLDARLRALGASPLAELTECDLDFERGAARWRDAAVESLARAADAKPAAAAESVASAASAYNRQHPFSAPVLANVALNGERGTRHLELSLEGSGLMYRPGDSLGVWPQNSGELAMQTAAMLGLEWGGEMELHGERAAVSEWLSSRLDLAMPTPAALVRYAAVCGADGFADSAAAKQYAAGRDWRDVLRAFPPPPGAAKAALECVRRLTPRLYSAASSARAREDEAHLLVARDLYYDAAGRARFGVCSSYLEGLREGDSAKVFVQPNENFHLPDDDNAALIMIGPGTGIAPFRAFLEEREERGGGGKNWLFFGERRRREDFYYQTEWLSRMKTGALARMDAAFSRDYATKVYVQHKMRRRAAPLWEWMRDGAHVYVCGDERRMAADVHSELCAIVRAHGEDGDSFLEKMRTAGRYQRDVY
ncbi:MAG: diflavin oxidoreductase [Gammaproteobacteria bacterium]